MTVPTRTRTHTHTVCDEATNRLCMRMLKCSKSVSIAPSWPPVVQAINPASSILADGTLARQKVKVKKCFLKDGVCHFLGGSYPTDVCVDLVKR